MLKKISSKAFSIGVESTFSTFLYSKCDLVSTLMVCMHWFNLIINFPQYPLGLEFVCKPASNVASEKSVERSYICICCSSATSVEATTT